MLFNIVVIYYLALTLFLLNIVSHLGSFKRKEEYKYFEWMNEWKYNCNSPIVWYSMSFWNYWNDMIIQPFSSILNQHFLVTEAAQLSLSGFTVHSLRIHSFYTLVYILSALTIRTFIYFHFHNGFLFIQLDLIGYVWLKSFKMLTWVSMNVKNSIHLHLINLFFLMSQSACCHKEKRELSKATSLIISLHHFPFWEVKRCLSG